MFRTNNENIKLPNFFIIGAPRSGTTALTEYLRSHPDVFISNPKEPLYFADDYGGIRQVQSLDEYLLLFSRTRKSHLVIGEASSWYLFSKNAIKNIYNFNKDAKIVIMLRNPVELCYSIHSNLMYMLYENEEDFEKAWELQGERKKGRSIPVSCKMPEFLQYGDVCSLGNLVDNVLQVFPGDRVKLVIFDDFINSTPDIYNDILNFLNLPGNNKEHFPKYNENQEHKSLLIARLMINPSPSLIRFAQILKNILHIKRIGIAPRILSLNTRKSVREKLSDDFIKNLKIYFKNDVEKLSKIIGRDLSSWLE